MQLMNEYVTHNECELIDTFDTELVGLIDISYKELVEKLGEPILSEGKRTAQWDVFFKDADTIATVYDYYSDKHYTNNTDWHIGGRSTVKHYHSLQAVGPCAMRTVCPVCLIRKMFGRL